MYIRIGVTISGVQSMLTVGESATINCTTDSPADSIMLLQNNRIVKVTQDGMELMHTISLLKDSIHGNIFKCVAHLTGRTNNSDTAFDNETVSLIGAYL